MRSRAKILTYGVRFVTFSQIRNQRLRYSFNKYGQIVTANVFWDPTPRTEFAIEYDWGRRVDKSGMRADAHRIGAVVQFSF